MERKDNGEKGEERKGIEYHRDELDLKKLLRSDHDLFYSGNILFNYASAWITVYYLLNENNGDYKSLLIQAIQENHHQA